VDPETLQYRLELELKKRTRDLEDQYQMRFQQEKLQYLNELGREQADFKKRNFDLESKNERLA